MTPNARPLRDRIEAGHEERQARKRLALPLAALPKNYIHPPKLLIECSFGRMKEVPAQADGFFALESVSSSARFERKEIFLCPRKLVTIVTTIIMAAAK